jgi:ABC-2 type transport system permease protein
MGTLIWKEIAEQWRSYRLIIVAAVLTAFGILGPLSAKYLPLLLAEMPGVPEGLAEIMPEPDAAMALTEYLDNLTQFGVILAILIPMGAVVGEKAGGTAEMTLSKPVSRAGFLAAKLVANGLTLGVGLLLAALAGYYYTGVLFTWPPLGPFVAANVLLWIYLLVFASLTLLASTVARSQLAAAGMSFGMLLLLGLLGAIPPFASRLPGAMLPWARALALGVAVEPAWSGLLSSAILAAAALLGAWLIFRRQEL